MGTNYYAVERKFSLHRNIIHIGKSSGGWKFNFQGYQDYELDWNKPHISINSVEDWKAFLSNKEEYGILNEYDEEISYEDFFNMVEEKQKENNKDDFRYTANINGYRFSYNDFS